MADREVDDDYLSEEQPHEEQDDDTKIEAEKANNVRTYIICTEILSLRAQELRKKLEVNHLGQLRGGSSITFETYMDYLACTQVPISIPTWRDVPEIVMDALQDDVHVIQ